MKNSKILGILVPLIAGLAALAAGLGVFWQGSGTHFDFKTLRGEIVRIQGDGLYKNDTVSMVSQAVAQDIVTLVVAIPLLIISLVLFERGLLRGKLLLAGTLGYFLYAYTSMTFLAAYNQLFLIYVALFSLSLFALILTLMTIELETLPGHFSAKLPRRTIAGFLSALSGFLILAWLGRIVPSLLDGGVPVGLENSTTLVIQALDLGIIVPLAVIAAVLLLQGKAWGYLLTSVVMVKGFSMLIALCAMLVGMLITGVQVSLVELLVFPILAVIGIILTVLLILNVKEESGTLKIIFRTVN
jgi:hypothetical protein